MKINRAKTALFLCVFLIGFCTFALLNTRRISRRMGELVNDARSVSMSDKSPESDSESIAGMIDDIKSAWQKYEPLLDIYSSHNEVERISENVNNLQALYDTQQYAQLNVSLCKITEALKHLMRTELPTVDNIL